MELEHMPVFISHRTTDDSLAKMVFKRLLEVHRIPCYIDDLDREANSARGTARVTEVILGRLELCTHLLALVTENTRGSWWVPFEIGVARRAPRIISTYTNVYRDLPEYLKE